MKIAVVGAGWAGLAAASQLHRQGRDVHVFEAAAEPGGRARPVQLPALGLTTDNGQHLLLGAYQATFALMRSVGIEPEQVCHVRPLKLQSADQRLRLGFWPLPAPLHRLGVLFGSGGLGGWRGLLHLARVLQAARPSDIPVDLTAADWLLGLGCPPALMRRLWAPLCLAATNTPLEETEARLWAQVLHDSLAAGPDASRLYIPHGTLDTLWPQAVRDRLGARLQRRRIQEIQPTPQGGWQLAGQSYDRLILAVPPVQARALLQSLPDANMFLDTWPQWRHAAIGTLSLRLSTPWDSGLSLALLWDDPARNAWGQWLFDRSASATAAADRTLVHIVIGRAERYAAASPEQLLDGVLEQIRRQAPKPLPTIDRWALITEKRATFDVSPGLRRPGMLTPWSGLLLAGDWTDTGYPAVLEGAVRSGLRAADALLSESDVQEARASSC